MGQTTYSQGYQVSRRHAHKPGESLFAPSRSELHPQSGGRCAAGMLHEPGSGRVERHTAEDGSVRYASTYS